MWVPSLGWRWEPGRAGAKPGGAGRGGVPFAVGVGSWRGWGGCLVTEEGLTSAYLSQSARSWLWPALTNIILALKSSCFMMSVSSPASTSGLVSPWDSLQQCSISWWPQATLSSCRFRMAMHREALGAWPEQKRREAHRDFRGQVSLQR